MINRFKLTTLTILSAFVLSQLSSCATTSDKWEANSKSKIIAQLEETRKTASVNNRKISESLSDALMPPLKIDFPFNQISSPVERFNVAVNKSKARDVYLNLVKSTAFSVILDPSIDGKISLQLKNVTLDDVFEYIEQAYGFHYEKKKSHYIVYGKKLTTRIFHVDYLNMNRGGSSGTNATSGGLLEGASSGVNIETKSNMDFWVNLKLDLETIVGNKDGRGITLNSHSGIIIARALPGELRMIANFLKQIQSSITRQVILEAKLLEVNLDDGYQTGINWSKVFNRGGSSLNIGQVAGTAGSLASPFGGVFSVALQTSNFTSFIELISTQGKVQVLSSPRIATINNQKAVIKVGGEEYFITGVKTNTSAINPAGNQTNTPPSVILTPFFSGIALDVTPQIDKDGNILLHLHPTVSNVTQISKNFTIDGKAYDLPLAASTVRETDTVVRAMNGQIIVVGGLMKQETVNTTASIPILGSLPFIGSLFRHKKSTRIKKELVVLVKPTIVESNSNWSNDAASTIMRFSELSD